MGFPGVETQTPDVVQQDVPQPETQTPRQDVPQQETQNPDVVQQENQCVDEGDGIDVSDFDKLVNIIEDMRESKYSDVDIIQCLGITESQLKEFEAYKPQSMVVVPESQTVP
ncbi:hypothetical protein L2E82_48210 [Cichorium intybus]|uniref:Uncharacterized protein n=1 Tax=Cichorium intybus TaxID=13427 RepID=A0ACB8YY53_CICIN|nr:hypothetical protein L2E82_48210 [Cichorium intybus]